MRIWLASLVLFAAGAGAACTRAPVPLADGGVLPSDDGGDVVDLAPPVAVDCAGDTKFPDCYSCCNANFQSGALDFDYMTKSCLCLPSTCASACANYVCGSQLGANAACAQCMEALDVDGGACQSTISQCLQLDGPCAGWKSCIDTCSSS